MKRRSFRAQACRALVSLAWLLMAGCGQRSPESSEAVGGAAAPPEGPAPAPAPESVGDSAAAALAAVEGLPRERYHASSVQEEMALFEVENDRWESEQIGEAISEQLHAMEAVLGQRAAISPEALERFVVGGDFRCSDLHGINATVSYDRRGIAVRRIPAQEGNETAPLVHAGAAGLAQALLAATGTASAMDVHFKLINLMPIGEDVVARVMGEAFADEGSARRQDNFTWMCRWDRGSADSGAPPRLRSVSLITWEQVVQDGDSPLFADCTEAVFVNAPEVRRQLRHGIDQWRSWLDHRLGTELTGSNGLAVGDVNGDGLDDVYLCAPGGLPNRLLLQQPDGSVRDAARAWGVDYLEQTHSALLLDLDNDADQDLVIASGQHVLWFEQTNGSFANRALVSTGAIARSMCAADFDRDGDLDIYVCGYFLRAGDSTGIGRPMPYHDANNGAPNHLLRNDGSWKFVDATEGSGLHENNLRFSYAAAWNDYDLDGDVDLYVANDFGRNNLYRNDTPPGGVARFVDVAAQAGVEDIAAGMSVSWGDYDGDGLADLYIGNMFSSAGNRVAFQREFREDGASGVRNQFRRHARGNTLFRNAGNGRFQDVTMAAGVRMGRWAWGSLFVDMNHDGWQDLLVANGMVTSPEDSGDL